MFSLSLFLFLFLSFSFIFFHFFVFFRRLKIDCFLASIASRFLVSFLSKKSHLFGPSFPFFLLLEWRLRHCLMCVYGHSTPTMQLQSLRHLDGTSPGSHDSRRPRLPSCVWRRTKKLFSGNPQTAGKRLPDTQGSSK